MKCVICSDENNNVDPGFDDGWVWYQADGEPESKVWACPTCASERTCMRCGTLMEENFVKEDRVDGQLITVTQVTCSCCGHSEIRYTIEEQGNG